MILSKFAKTLENCLKLTLENIKRVGSGTKWQGVVISKQQKLS